ncbi:Glycoside hydrolase superfamily [Phytophthora cactorum]|nr:Glycoside hydrolase superfamily [Phytophthora cactorum]
MTWNPSSVLLLSRLPPWNSNYYQCRAKPAQCGNPEVGMDYNGADIADSTGMKLPDECCNKCAGIHVHQQRLDGQPHCYLKSSTDTRKQVVGAVSATVSSSRSTNTTGGHIQAQFRSGTVHPKEKGIAAFEQHRKTWITEADIKEIADTGVLNTVRIPVGHWIIRDATTAPVSPVTLGNVGSQTNIDNSIKFATFLAARYKNSPAFLGMALMKEPVPPADGNALQHYYIEAYKQIRATGNDCILLVTPFLCDQDPDHLKGMIGAPQYTNVWNEMHAYFIWGYEGKTEEQVLAAIDQYDQSHLKSAPTNNRLFLAGTKITCLLQHRYYGRLGILDVATLG